MTSSSETPRLFTAPTVLTMLMVVATIVADRVFIAVQVENLRTRAVQVEMLVKENKELLQIIAGRQNEVLNRLSILELKERELEHGK